MITIKKLAIFLCGIIIIIIVVVVVVKRRSGKDPIPPTVKDQD